MDDELRVELANRINRIKSLAVEAATLADELREFCDAQDYGVSVPWFESKWTAYQLRTVVDRCEWMLADFCKSPLDTSA